MEEYTATQDVKIALLLSEVQLLRALHTAQETQEAQNNAPRPGACQDRGAAPGGFDTADSYASTASTHPYRSSGGSYAARQGAIGPAACALASLPASGAHSKGSSPMSSRDSQNAPRWQEDASKDPWGGRQAPPSGRRDAPASGTSTDAPHRAHSPGGDDAPAAPPSSTQSRTGKPSVFQHLSARARTPLPHLAPAAFDAWGAPGGARDEKWEYGLLPSPTDRNTALTTSAARSAQHADSQEPGGSPLRLPNPPSGTCPICPCREADSPLPAGKWRNLLTLTCSILSDKMYLLISYRKSISPPNHQLVVYNYQLRY
jgi:hypothetical protein